MGEHGYYGTGGAGMFNEEAEWHDAANRELASLINAFDLDGQKIARMAVRRTRQLIAEYGDDRDEDEDDE